MTDSRELRMEYLLEATGEKTKSKALDRAAEFYLQMRGDTAAVPNGAFVDLMEKAEKQGSVTAEEIAEILYTNVMPVKAETSWSIG
jgi:hypothetical protein